jgi:hypothetical protein
MHTAERTPPRFAHILCEIAPISPEAWTAASTWVKRGSMSRSEKAYATAFVGAEGPRRDAAEALGVTEKGQSAHRRIPEAGATKASGLLSTSRAVPDRRPPSVSDRRHSGTLISCPTTPLKAPLDTRFHLDAAPLDLCFPSMLESYC